MYFNRNIKEFGHCTNIHGHNYALEITVQGEVNKETNCILNLHKLKNIVDREVIDILDHKYLNDILPGGRDKPITLEILGDWVWKQLSNKITGAKLYKIKIWETPENSLEIFGS